MSFFLVNLLDFHCDQKLFIVYMTEQNDILTSYQSTFYQKNDFKNRFHVHKMGQAKKQKTQISSKYEEIDEQTAISLLNQTPPKIVQEMPNYYRPAFANRSFKQLSPFQDSGQYIVTQSESPLARQVLQNHKSQKLVQKMTQDQSAGYPTQRSYRTIVQKQNDLVSAFKKLQFEIHHQFEKQYLLQDYNISETVNRLNGIYKQFLQRQKNQQDAIRKLDRILQFNRYLKKIFLNYENHGLQLSSLQLSSKIFSKSVYESYLRSAYTLCQIKNQKLQEQSLKLKQKENLINAFNQKSELPDLDQSSQHFKDSQFKRQIIQGHYYNMDLTMGEIQRSVKPRSSSQGVPSYQQFVHTILVPDLKKVITRFEAIVQEEDVVANKLVAI